MRLHKADDGHEVVEEVATQVSLLNFVEAVVCPRTDYVCAHAETWP